MVNFGGIIGSVGDVITDAVDDGAVSIGGTDIGILPGQGAPMPDPGPPPAPVNPPWTTQQKVMAGLGVAGLGVVVWKMLK